MISAEVIIKSKKRVQNHGEVFTPKWIIDKILDNPGIKEACENIEATFLEPSVGEGAFLIAILIRKLEIVSSLYNDSLKQYEHYSLFVLTTLYGVELLQDNAKICSMNLYEVYVDYYIKSCDRHGTKKIKNSVLNSAKTIISANIQQGNFLTRLTDDGEPLVFSEWKPSSELGVSRTIKVTRTEYTLEDISNQVIKPYGEIVRKVKSNSPIQLDLFSPLFTDEREEELKYSTCMITDVHKRLMEKLF